MKIPKVLSRRIPVKRRKETVFSSCYFEEKGILVRPFPHSRENLGKDPSSLKFQG